MSKEEGSKESGDTDKPQIDTPAADLVQVPNPPTVPLDAAIATAVALAAELPVKPPHKLVYVTARGRKSTLTKDPSTLLELIAEMVEMAKPPDLINNPPPPDQLADSVAWLRDNIGDPDATFELVGHATAELPPVFPQTTNYIASFSETYGFPTWLLKEVKKLTAADNGDFLFKSANQLVALGLTLRMRFANKKRVYSDKLPQELKQMMDLMVTQRALSVWLEQLQHVESEVLLGLTSILERKFSPPGSFIRLAYFLTNYDDLVSLKTLKGLSSHPFAHGGTTSTIDEFDQKADKSKAEMLAIIQAVSAEEVKAIDPDTFMRLSFSASEQAGTWFATIAEALVQKASDIGVIKHIQKTFAPGSKAAAQQKTDLASVGPSNLERKQTAHAAFDIFDPRTLKGIRNVSIAVALLIVAAVAGKNISCEGRPTAPDKTDHEPTPLQSK